MTISVTRLWLDSYPWFSRPTRLWHNSFESESSQIWLTTHESSTTLVPILSTLVPILSQDKIKSEEKSNLSKEFDCDLETFYSSPSKARICTHTHAHTHTHILSEINVMRNSLKSIKFETIKTAQRMPLAGLDSRQITNKTWKYISYNECSMFYSNASQHCLVKKHLNGTARGTRQG